MSGQLATSDMIEILYAAKKYDIKDFEMECMQFLKTNISEENVVSIFQAAQMFDEEQLKKQAHALLSRNFNIVMQHEDFHNMSKENLRLVLQDDDTFASELSIFHAALRWAEAECLKTSVSVSPENQRLVLGDILQLVRLLLITSEDIAIKVIPSAILTPQESNLLLRHKSIAPGNRGELPSFPFNDRRRIFSTFKAVLYSEFERLYIRVDFHPSTEMSIKFHVNYCQLWIFWT